MPPAQASPTQAPPTRASPGGPPLVPGRECGSCNVCCVSLTINDPRLRKLPGVRCPNNAADGRCAIYHSRPTTCRTYYCGWRYLPWIKQSLRPNDSSVLVSVRDHGGGRAVMFMMLDQGALAAPGFPESVAAAVAAGVPTFVVVPGPPGYTAGVVQLNEALAGPVRARDQPGVLAVLHQAWQGGQHGDHEPVAIDDA